MSNQTMAYATLAKITDKKSFLEPGNFITLTMKTVNSLMSVALGVNFALALNALNGLWKLRDF